MIQRINRIILVTLLCTSSSAFALRTPAQQLVGLTPPAPDPWYFGLGIGKSATEYNRPTLISEFNAASATSSFNHDDFSFNLFGGYKLDHDMSLELGISELGSIIATNGTSASQLFNIYTAYIDTALRHHYNKSAVLYGKLGAHFWSLETSTNHQQLNGTDILLGAGIEIALYHSQQYLFRIDWSHYRFDDVYLNATNTLTLNLIINHSL